jgi:hypothetical protein
LIAKGELEVDVDPNQIITGNEPQPSQDVIPTLPGDV